MPARQGKSHRREKILLFSAHLNESMNKKKKEITSFQSTKPTRQEQIDA